MALSSSSPNLDEYELATLLTMLRQVRETVKINDKFDSRLDHVIEDLEQYGRERLDFACSYQFAHTRHWCGHPLCRES